ncbi:MAG: DUF1264 domain-containing protein [Dehalococcoidia bacterium]|nr:DUF1264 domain-containing protein [Dehalococcoidia bacterium]
MSKKALLFISVVIIIISTGLSYSLPRTDTTGKSPATGFTLHIAAKKHINDMQEWVVHHYCKPINKDVSQCTLFESDEPNAKLIGVETIISPQLYAALPDAEKTNWHYHKTEIPLSEATLPDLNEKDARQVIAALEDTYGKVVIFWEPNEPAPIGISITRPH